MKTSFKNLDDAFFYVNRAFLTNPNEMVDFVRGVQGFKEDLLIKVKKPVSTLNLYKFAFDPQRKWTHLIGSYIEPDDYWAFWEKLPKVSGTSFQFRFKNKLSSNGPCLIAIVLTRNDSSAKWSRAKVIWRTAEVQRKWAADMVLIHNFFREIPEYCQEIIDIQEVSLYLSQAFQSCRLIGPLIDLFCEPNQVDMNHNFSRRAIEHFEKVYASDDPHKSKFAPVVRMQEYYKKKLAGTLGESHPDELSLVDAVRRIEERRK